MINLDENQPSWSNPWYSIWSCMPTIKGMIWCLDPASLMRQRSWRAVEVACPSWQHFSKIKFWFLGLSHFRDSYNSIIATLTDIENSIYMKTVKLNQIELSNQLNCGESENIFKAFIEHDLDWTLIAQSYFLWQRTPAWWAQWLYVRPSLREKEIIVWLCVNSVCQSTLCESCFYPGRKPWRK
jgi:hypothetical protein